jgi:hypothetical protein
MNRNQNNNHTLEAKGTWEVASRARVVGPIFVYEKEGEIINFSNVS